MQVKFSKPFFHRLFVIPLLCAVMTAGAQPTGLLYDPEPPVDSAYVRVINAAPSGLVDVRVDGRARVQKLSAGETSEYMVIPAGKHTITLHAPGKQEAQLTTLLDVIQGRATTVAFSALLGNSAPVVFEDKANTNKLKALLSVYHLAAKAEPFDVLSIDGKTKVFSNVTYGASVSIPVNPISIELMAAKVGEITPQASTSLAMSQGGTYSVLLLATEGGKIKARSVQNKIERYTGK